MEGIQRCRIPGFATEKGLYKAHNILPSEFCPLIFTLYMLENEIFHSQSVFTDELEKVQSKFGQFYLQYLYSLSVGSIIRVWQTLNEFSASSSLLYNIIYLD